MEFLAQEGDRVLLTLRVQPRSSRNRIAGRHGDAIKLSITTPPVDGKANEAVISYLAKLCNLPKSAISIVRGDKSRTKQVALAGCTVDQISAILEPLLD